MDKQGNKYYASFQKVNVANCSLSFEKNQFSISSFQIFCSTQLFQQKIEKWPKNQALLFVIALSAFRKMQNNFVEDVTSEPIAQRNARQRTGKEPDRITNSGNITSRVID